MNVFKSKIRDNESSLKQLQHMIVHIFICILQHLRVYYELTMRHLPVGLIVHDQLIEQCTGIADVIVRIPCALCHLATRGKVRTSNYESSTPNGIKSKLSTSEATKCPNHSALLRTESKQNQTLVKHSGRVSLKDGIHHMFE